MQVYQTLSSKCEGLLPRVPLFKPLHSSSLHFLSFLCRHWLQAGGLLLVVLASIVTGVYVGAFSGLDTKYRIATICFIAVLNIILFK